MITEWQGFTAKEYENFLNTMREPDELDGTNYLATIYIGQIRAILNIERGFGGVPVLSAKIEVGGIDTGYDYTIEGNLPFSIVGVVFIANQYDFVLFQPIDVFKEKVEEKIIAYVNGSQNDDFINKMNSTERFDWT